MVKRESIDALTKKSIKAVRRHLASLGIDVPAVDGPSDDTHLGSLQEWQALDAALDSHVSKQVEQRTSQSGADARGLGAVSSYSADTMDSTGESGSTTGKKR
jgi:hypothetical protein